jgi:Na+/H+ antiporter NhaA
VSVRRLIAPFFAAAGLVLIPWTVWLTFSLPAHHETENWRTVWAGFDAAQALALLATAVTAVRRSPWLAPVAAIAGTLLCVDAWFDITLEAGDKHLLAAVLEAVLVELPLAAICFWVARDAERARLQLLRPWRRAVLRAWLEPPGGD